MSHKNLLLLIITLGIFSIFNFVYPMSLKSTVFAVNWSWFSLVHFFSKDDESVKITIYVVGVLWLTLSGSIILHASP